MTATTSGSGLVRGRRAPGQTSSGGETRLGTPRLPAPEHPGPFLVRPGASSRRGQPPQGGGVTSSLGPHHRAGTTADPGPLSGVGGFRGGGPGPVPRAAAAPRTADGRSPAAAGPAGAGSPPPVPALNDTVWLAPARVGQVTDGRPITAICPVCGIDYRVIGGPVLAYHGPALRRWAGGGVRVEVPR